MASADPQPNTTPDKPADSKPTSEASVTASVTVAASPSEKLLAQLPALLVQADYNEVYGLTLTAAGDFHTRLIVQKFLRANANDVEKARTQLLETLKWRKEFQPLRLRDEKFNAAAFGGLGYVATVPDVPAGANRPGADAGPAVVTFNVYGAVTDTARTFGDLDGFVRWRVALMELGIATLGLGDATAAIPDYGQGPDPYQGVQVHDYRDVSFLRMDPHARAASKRTIEVLQRYYPETLRRKFFVNVPRVMQWMFAVLRGVVMSKDTSNKFCVLTHGSQLAGELGDGVPQEYGGNGPELATLAQTVPLEAATTENAETDGGKAGEGKAEEGTAEDSKTESKAEEGTAEAKAEEGKAEAKAEESKTEAKAEEGKTEAKAEEGKTEAKAEDGKTD